MKSPIHHILATALPTAILAFGVLHPSATRAALVAQYHFDEASGPTAFDSAGSFNGTLSLTGAAFVPGGISGNAISLDKATGGLVNMGTAFPSFTSGDFSIVLWAKTNTTATDSLIVGKHESGFQNGYFVVVNQTGGGGAANKATFTVGAEFVPSSPTSTSSINDDSWHQVVGVFNAGGTHKIYVDGSPVEASTPSQSVPNLGAAFMVGGVSASGTPQARYTGLVDEVQVYSQALTDAQIDFLFANPSQAIPEPTTGALLGMASVGWLAGRRRNRKANPATR